AVEAIAVQPDGKTIIGGSFTSVLGTTRKYIARFNADGTLDMTFNPNADYDVLAVAVQPDGKIVIGGYFSSVQPNGAASATTRNDIERVNADGSLDTGFDPNANSDVYSVVVQPDGAVLLGGYFTTLHASTRNYIARVNADGSLDMGFNPNANSL